ncbi:MAG: HEAT repeat domain-containing protein [Candidatus Latescibacterota bacterium]
MTVLRLLNLRRNEVPRLAHAAAVFFLVSVNDGVVKSVAAAVFNVRQGVEHLPAMYSWIAVLFCLSMAALSYLSARLSRRRLLFALLGAVLAVLVHNTGVLVLEHYGATPPALRRFFYPFLFVSSELARSLIGFHIWIVASGICYASRAKVLFPLLVASATLGDISAGVGVRLLGPALPSYLLYGTSVSLIAVVLVLMRSLVRRYLVAQPAGGEGGGASLAENVRFLAGSGYLQLLFVLSIGVFALYTSIHYGFNVVGRQRYPAEGELSALFGSFYAATGIGTLAVTAIVLQRLLRRLGTANIYLWVAALYGAIVLALAGVTGGLLPVSPVAAVFALNLLSFLLLDSVVAPTYYILVKLVPQRHSDGTRMVMEGGFMLLGGLTGAGLTALHARGMLSLGGLFAGLAGLAAVMAACGFLLRNAYTRVLVRAVREQDVAVDDDQAMASLGRVIAGSTEVSRGLLLHRDDSVRQMGIEILRRHPGPHVARTCLPLTGHDNPRIRGAALEALTAGSEANEAIPHVLPRLDDPDPDVRRSAGRALARVLGNGDRPARVGLDPATRQRLVEAALPRLATESAPQLAELLVVLERVEHEPSAPQRAALLERLVNSLSEEERTAGIQAAMRTRTADVRAQVIASLDHPHPDIREAAAEYLGAVPTPAGFGALLGGLADPDPDVLAAVIRALGQAPAPQRQALVHHLQTCSLREWEGALAALIAADDEGVSTTLSASCRSRLVEASRLLVIVEGLRLLPPSPAVDLLVDQLREETRVARNGAVRLLGYLGDVHVVGDLLEQLTGGSPAARDSAVELLENIADRELMRHLLPLLEEDQEARLQAARQICGSDAPEPRRMLEYLLQSTSPWTQLAAAWAATDLGATELLCRLVHAPSEPLQQVLGEIARRGEGRAMTGEVPQDLPLTTMEKITFLKESEFFAALPLEELYHIATSMEEQTVKQGAVVIQEGTLGDRMYIVVRGELEVRKGSGPRIAVLGEKQVFGEMALLDDEPRSASVIALGEVHLLSLQRSNLERLLRRYSSIAFNMMRILSRRLRSSMAPT